MKELSELASSMMVFSILADDAKGRHRALKSSDYEPAMTQYHLKEAGELLRRAGENAGNAKYASERLAMLDEPTWEAIKKFQKGGELEIHKVLYDREARNSFLQEISMKDFESLKSGAEGTIRNVGPGEFYNLFEYYASTAVIVLAAYVNLRRYYVMTAFPEQLKILIEDGTEKER